MTHTAVEDPNKVVNLTDNLIIPRTYRYYGGRFLIDENKFWSNPRGNVASSGMEGDIIHFRKVTLAFSWASPNGPKTFEKVRCALTLTSEKDSFCRKTGREIAAGRLKTGPNFTFSMPGFHDRSLLDLAVDYLVDKYYNKTTCHLFKQALKEMMWCSYFIKREITGEFYEECIASILKRKPNLIPQEYNMALGQPLATHFKILGIK